MFKVDPDSLNHCGFILRSLLRQKSIIPARYKRKSRRVRIWTPD